MFDRIKRSFDLVRASVHVLQQDRQLLWFPVISALAWLAVVAAFALPLFGIAAFDGIGKGGLYSTAFLFYVVQYFVIFYFNTALVGAVMLRLDGGTPTLRDGLRIANGRFGATLGYAVIAATVGVVLRAVQERLGFVGRLIVGLLGAGWAVATFLVVPVIVMRASGRNPERVRAGRVVRRLRSFHAADWPDPHATARMKHRTSGDVHATAP